MDFVSDGLATGRAFRIFTLVDSFTRECPALEVDSCLSSRRVTRVLDWVIEQRGAPDAIRCDNGPEFPRGTAEKPANEGHLKKRPTELRQDKGCYTSPAAVLANLSRSFDWLRPILGSTWAEDTAPQGCDRSAVQGPEWRGRREPPRSAAILARRR